MTDGLSQGFCTHVHAAWQERLLSWRAVLDAALARLEEPPAVGGKGARPRLLPEAFWTHRQAVCREDLLAIQSLCDGFFGWLEREPPPAGQKATRVVIE
jgi:hypothetical protein